MRYRGKIDQITIFGQVEFIDTEDYRNKVSKNKGYLHVSGKYKIVGTDEEIELSLEFLGTELSRHATF